MKYAFVAILVILTGGNASAQNVTIAERNVPLRKIMNLILKQTGYYFSLSSGVPGTEKNVSLVVKNVPLKEALDRLTSDKAYTYMIVYDSIIAIIDRKKKATPEMPAPLIIKGRVENENDDPLPFATVSVMNSNKGTISNHKGEFHLSGLPQNAIIQISSVGYETQVIAVTDHTAITARLKLAAKGLDETVVIAYGKTSRRLNTGNVYKVNGKEIVDQPVANFVAALPGRVPGLLISQKNGIPGTSYQLEIRGRASIGTKSGAIPEANTLIIVDGIPFAPNNNNLPTIASGSAIGDPGRNAFDLINTNDIESIEVLKDADATAIYGSRGANGVILVTTKKGVCRKPTINIHVNAGLGRITRFPAMMNTEQYVAMRREAITNDGNTPNPTNAPDLFKWDTTRYTDFKKELIGGTARIYNAHISISGGNHTTRYYLSASGRKETTVFPGNFSDNLLYSHGALDHHSKNNKLTAGLSLLLTHDNNHSLSRDMTVYVSQPPHAPAFYDSVGNLIWQQGGSSYNNPAATLRQPYHAITDQILLGAHLSYRLMKGLTVKVNGGTNNFKSDESILQPRSSLNTFTTPNVTGQAFFANSKLKSRIVEPQLEYAGGIGKGKLNILVGGAYQTLTTRIINETGYGYPDDSLLKDISKAATRFTTPTNSNYKYAGAFARISYDYMNRYLINLTGRRDGSSRFGPGRQYGNFGAFGAAWIFSQEPFINRNSPFFSFGKLRASYGVTGSDQIGDYRFLDQWNSTQNTYMGITGIVPARAANGNYSWQENRKLEAAIELGLLKNRFFLTTTYYRNRTGNQLIAIPLPAQTGFERLSAANYPAVVQNSGWEISLQYNSKPHKDFNVGANFILTIPDNKLQVFPYLSNAEYASNIFIDKSLSVVSRLTYTGKDQHTGLFTFKDFDNDDTISYPNDYSIIADLAPEFFGSLTNTISFKNWAINWLVEFKKQASYNLLYKIYQSKIPGLSRSNQPTLLADHWQKLTASNSSPAYGTINSLLNSSAVFSDASYIRIKMLSIAYNLPVAALKKLNLQNCKLYLSANNLALLTRFKGTDPETVDILTLPPLRTIAAGIQLSF